jgi:hypothetical protein
VAASGVLDAWACVEFSMQAEVRRDPSHVPVLIGKDEARGDA